MKKRILLVGLLALVLVGGCQCKYTDSNNVTTENFVNCLKKVQDMVCNPPAAVMALINTAAPFVTAIVNTAVPGTVAYINAQNALNAINSIKEFGCLSMTSLASLVSFLESEAFTSKVAAAKGVKPGMVVFDTSPLKVWAEKK